MTSNTSEFSASGPWDVCIIGTGRVGLPLGLSLMEVGIKAVGLEIDETICARINAGEMPFAEPGYEELIKTRAFQATSDSTIVPQCDALIITVGTPVHSHIETDLSQIRKVLHQICPLLRPGHFICLRSTIAPGTTTFVKKYIERETSLRVGTDLKLAFCPERIAEGYAHEELGKLPQVVGSEDPMSKQAALKLFSQLAPEILHTDFVSAELLKLFGNITRYIYFAVANQLALIADTFNANIHEIRQLANYCYPRTQIAMPGLTAGTCLRKDYGMINELSPYPDLLLSAWKINEYVPAFLVKHQAKRQPLENQVVTILGYSFKSNTDDTRDSLAPKMLRYIQRELPKEIRVSDHNLPDIIPDTGDDKLKNWAADEACRDSDCIFVATNHDGYKEVLERLAVNNPQAWIIDLWNMADTEKIFYRAGELLDKDTKARIA